MLIAAFGDQHYRAMKPSMRIDDYLTTQKNKLIESLTICKELGVYHVCLPGDVFDTHAAPHGLVENLIGIFRNYANIGMTFYVVWGQHDQRYHTAEKTNTPLGVLAQALHDQMVILGSEPVQPSLSKNISIYGASWGEDVPIIQNTDFFNILVTHRFISRDTVDFMSEKVYLAQEIAKDWLYNLVISGDNHQQFATKVKNKVGTVILNAGSLLRQKTDQVLHKPGFYVYDTENNQVFKEYLTIVPSDKVFQITAHKNTDETISERLQQFIDKLQTRTTVAVDFKSNIVNAISSSNIDPLTAQVIHEVMENL